MWCHPNTTTITQMKCKSGIWVETLQQNVPCGQCMPCRINKGRHWSARIIMEWLTTPQRSYFLTFTYNEENLPPGGTLEKQKFRQFLKNAQKRHTGPFRYYLVGEYGDESFRPHYHLAIFPQHPAQVGLLTRLWQKGFTQATEINHARARYLANYTAKKLTKGCDPRLEGREPEFRSSSRNPPLGYQFTRLLAAQPTVKKEVARTGDVPRTFRIDGKIYPFGSWPLTQLRDLLSVPQSHAGRIKAHPEYLNHYELEDTEWNPQEAQQLEVKINAKKKITFYRGESAKV